MVIEAILLEFMLSLGNTCIVIPICSSSWASYREERIFIFTTLPFVPAFFLKLLQVIFYTCTLS